MEVDLLKIRQFINTADFEQHGSELSRSTHVCAQSRPLLVAPWTVNLPGSSVHRLFQARTLEQGAISYFRE